MDLGVRPRRARTGRAATLVTLAAALGLATAGPAGAAIGPFSTQPSSGPPGTSFTVSGSGCGPGLFASASDYVSVSSTSLPLNVHVPVNSAGSWSTSFSVPGGSLPVPAVIAALCFTDGLPSLTTIYTPGTFVVTAASTPTTAPPPPPPTTPTTVGSTGTTPTTKGTTASTKPGGKGSGAGSGSGGGATTGAGSGSGSGKSGRAGNAGGRAGANGSATAGGIAGTAAKRSGAVAGLRSPELTSDTERASSGISPWWWALLALVVAGAVGTWLWFRHRGASSGTPGPSTPGAPGDPVSDSGPGTADPLDDPDDDWPSFPVLDEEPTVTR